MSWGRVAFGSDVFPCFSVFAEGERGREFPPQLSKGTLILLFGFGVSKGGSVKENRHHLPFVYYWEMVAYCMKCTGEIMGERSNKFLLIVADSVCMPRVLDKQKSIKAKPCSPAMLQEKW